MRNGTRLALFSALIVTGCHSADKQTRPTQPYKPFVLPATKTDGPGARSNNAKTSTNTGTLPIAESAPVTVSVPAQAAPKPIALEPMQPIMPAPVPVLSGIVPPTQPGTMGTTLPPIAESNGNLVVPSLTGTK